MNKIYYLGYYDIPEYAHEKRNVPPAAYAKMNYIVSAINKLGYTTEIISPAAAQNKRFARARKTELGNGNTLKVFCSMGGKNKVAALFRFWYLRLSLIFYFLFNVKSSDTVLVYHSAEIIKSLLFVKKLKRFRLVLEVEEIYADVTGNNKTRKAEYKLFGKSDAFVFSTELLEEKINRDNRSYAVVYGSYLIPEISVPKSADNNEIGCVYAGTFDMRKGVLVAVKAARFLPENYHIHILGFGSEKEINQIKETIAEISVHSSAKISYHGLLSGREYTDFLSNCRIGLSPQKLDSEFNETSFPSKILSYICCGLRVVSVRLKSLETSKLKDYISFYDGDSPEELAKAIQRVDLDNADDPAARISDLDVEFTKKLGELLCPRK